MVKNDDSLHVCAQLAGRPLVQGPNGPELDGVPVQCLMLPIEAGEALGAALRAAAASPLGPGVVLHAATRDPRSERYCLVLERGEALPAGSAAEGAGGLDLERLGERAAYWQQCHPPEPPPAGGGYRRGVLQQQIREQAERVRARLDATSQGVLDTELRHQGLYRFEDLPIAGSYWRGVRAHAGGPGLGDLVVPPAPVPAFWQLARIALDVAVDTQGRPQPDIWHVVLAGYHRQRSLVPVERGATPTLVRLAALADWLEQLEAGHAGTAERARLEGLQAHADRLQATWVRAAA